MSKDDVSTPAEEVKDPANQATDSDSSKDDEEVTIADAVNESSNKAPDQIPYNRFQEKVNENKELKSRLDKLETMINDNQSKDKVEDDIADIADEYGIEADVLDKVAQSLYSKAEKAVEEKLAVITERERRTQQDQIISKMIDDAIESNPDYKDVVNKDVIRQLANNSDNHNKTISSLLHETYGSLVNKKIEGMENNTPGKTETIEKLDFERAITDSDYMKKVKADSSLKDEFNKKQMEQLTQYL